MTRPSGKQILLSLLVVLPLAVGGWLYANRRQRIDIARYVPETAVGYLEVNDWPQLLDRLTSTRAWQQLAPAYGISDKLNYAGRFGWLASLTGSGETALLARSQFAVAVTGIEVRGEEVKPHLALIAETHSSPEALQRVAEARLPELARNAFGQVVKENSEYSGVKVTSYRAADADRGLFAAQIGSELIVANQLDSLRACIDTRLGRTASIINNFYLQNSRSIVERDGTAFGFVTGDGVTRLLRFGAFLLSGGAIGKAALAGAVGQVFTEFSTRATDGIAYGASFEDGQVVDRYALLFKPELVDTLKSTVKPNAKPARVFDVIPASASGVTLINVENPMKTLDGIEAAISARVDAGQSFLLHQFVLGARETFFGMKKGNKPEEAIGDEIASFDLPARRSSLEQPDEPDRIWLIAVRDAALMLTIAERAMIASGAELSREKHAGVEIINSSDAARGSVAFIGDFVALGKREQLMRLVDLLGAGRSLKAVPQFAAANKFPQPVAIESFASVKEDAHAMMAAIALWETGKAATPQPALDQLPLAASGTSAGERGIYIESRSPFGNFPFFISLIAGSTNNRKMEN